MSFQPLSAMISRLTDLIHVSASGSGPVPRSAIAVCVTASSDSASGMASAVHRCRRSSPAVITPTRRPASPQCHDPSDRRVPVRRRPAGKTVPSATRAVMAGHERPGPILRRSWPSRDASWIWKMTPSRGQLRTSVVRQAERAIYLRVSGQRQYGGD
jgi:hypothetical protein